MIHYDGHHLSYRGAVSTWHPICNESEPSNATELAMRLNGEQRDLLKAQFAQKMKMLFPNPNYYLFFFIHQKHIVTWGFIILLYGKKIPMCVHLKLYRFRSAWGQVKDDSSFLGELLLQVSCLHQKIRSEDISTTSQTITNCQDAEV